MIIHCKYNQSLLFIVNKIIKYLEVANINLSYHHKIASSVYASFKRHIFTLY